MSMYNPDVKISLKDLAELKHAADLLEFANDQCKASTAETDRCRSERDDFMRRLTDSEKRAAVLDDRIKKWEHAEHVEKAMEDAQDFLDQHDTPFNDADLDRACNIIRALMLKIEERDLSTRPTTRELHPLTKTAISHANDVLRALHRPISSEENLQNETVAAVHFHTVYDALKNLVSRFEQGDGLS